MNWFSSLDIPTLYYVFGFIGAASGAFTAIYKFYKSVLKPVIKNIKTIVSFAGKIDELLNEFQDMKAQFKPSDGDSLRDVLDRLETHVAVSNTKIHSIMNYHRIPAWESDLEGNWNWTSDELLRMLDTSSTITQGLGWLSLLKASDRNRVSQEWAEANAQGREFRITCSFDTDPELTVEARAIQITSGNGDVKGYIGTLREKTT